MELVAATVEAYAEKITTPEQSLQKKINQRTYATHAHPHMLSGHVQGQVLSFLSQMQRPKYILEIGTFTGYSALCLAEGLVPDGQLHTIELREDDAGCSQRNFDQSIHKNKIHLHIGNALDIISQLPYSWDLVFIDADKNNYIHYYELVMERLSPRGIILADNVLFHGQIFEEPLKGKNPKAMIAFNEHVLADPRSEQVLLTIRDGLLLIKQKSNEKNIPVT